MNGATAAILERAAAPVAEKALKRDQQFLARYQSSVFATFELSRYAHGVSRYNSDALRRIAGQHTRKEIDAILGYEYGPVAVHRDDMITR